MRISLSDDLSDDELEEEPSHPIGFKSPLGRTWFSLDPPTQSQVNAAAFGRSTYAWLDDSDSEDDETKENKVYVQSYPPLTSYIRNETATTAALLSANRNTRRHTQTSVPLLTYGEREDELKYSDDEEEEDDQPDLTLVTRSAPLPIPAAIQEALAPPPPSQRARAEQAIQQKIQAERQRVEEECRRNTEILSIFVLKSEKEAAAIRQRREAEEEKIRQQQEAHEEQKRQVKAAQDAQAAKEKEEKAQRDRQQQKEQAAAAQKQQEADEQAKKKVEFIEKAKERVKYVIQVHKSIEPFEANKAVGKRRLGMKKIARGKLNTLSESAQKVQQVANEVAHAVSQARHDDAVAKQALEQKQPGVTPDMKIGKRYLLDLLAANAMTRVQAESFSGVKGDAFPLAAMLSMLSVENKDFTPILEGHVYMVCPTAIPTLPSPKPNASEEELMIGLGMQKGKDGEFESFPRFLSRTENIISFMADMQASIPSTNVLFGGNLGAVKWLTRFLDLLPPPPTSPLPLLTAPVLAAFLTGAGHMLANKHADAFKKLLDTILKDIVNRLDEGEIGKPFATRLNKVLEGGFEHFRTHLPIKAIPELYFGASGESKKHSEGSVFGGTIGNEDDQEQNAQTASHPFGRQTSQNQAANPFGGGSFGSAPAQNPFGGVSTGAVPSASTSSFGAASTISNSSESPFNPPSAAAVGFGSPTNAPSSGPFSTTKQQNSSSSPFGSMSNNAQQQSTPFGASSSSNTGFGSAAVTSSNPFGSGTNSNPNPTPFGASTASSPFGGSNVPAPSPAPFGGAQNNFAGNPSPFGGGQDNPTANPSPFGGGMASSPSPFSGGMAASPSPFASGNNSASQTTFSNQGASSFGSAGNSNPFGSSSTNATASPFGANAPSSSPFSAPASTPFGNTGSTAQPFGSTTTNASPSAFGGAQNAPNPSPFSNQNSTPFGGGGTTPFGSSGGTSTPFGASSGTNPTPFGGGYTAPSPSPFSNQTQSPFGASSNTQQFGSGSNTNPSFGSSSFAGPSGFGSNTQQNQGFGSGGGGNKKEPCKFFARGNCRFGANCRYSHDLGPGGSNSAFGGGSSGFGGNSSGFGGANSSFGGNSSGFGGGFGSNTPFGGPRR
jgi:GLE1-like protein/CCCH-type zinc finger